MMDPTSYPYTTKEQQALKRPYPFVDYGGKEFFSAYKKTRETAIEELEEQNLDALETNSSGVEDILELQGRYGDLIDGRLRREIENLSRRTGYKTKNHEFDPREWYARLQEQEEIDIEDAVYNLHLTLSSNPDALQPGMEYLLRRILKKAELRILRKSCDWDFKNTSQEEPSLETYAYLATTLLLMARKTGDTQALSTALKLNDFLISQRDQFSTVKESFLTYIALRLELQEITRLADSKGVEL